MTQTLSGWCISAIATATMLYKRKEEIRKAAPASVLGEYFEASPPTISPIFLLVQLVDSGEFVHYPSECWFALPADGGLPGGILNDYLCAFTIRTRISHQSSDGTTIYIPANIVGNLYF
ncbi:MAG: hypothetical protein GPOALKHO_000777 [Sodalis sp.]|nr:MAG: hypothetical protein GPOALKHO_000777 [Sodalis sp.]